MVTMLLREKQLLAPLTPEKPLFEHVMVPILLQL